MPRSRAESAVVRSDADHEFRIRFTYTPALEERISGPPEDCYPGEPEEFELDSIHLRIACARPWRSPWIEITNVLVCVDDAEYGSVANRLLAEAIAQFRSD